MFTALQMADKSADCCDQHNEFTTANTPARLMERIHCSARANCPSSNDLVHSQICHEMVAPQMGGLLDTTRKYLHSTVTPSNRKVQVYPFVPFLQSVVLNGLQRYNVLLCIESHEMVDVFILI